MNRFPGASVATQMAKPMLTSMSNVDYYIGNHEQQIIEDLSGLERI
jgi:hypothetical protein